MMGGCATGCETKEERRVAEVSRSNTCEGVGKRDGYALCGEIKKKQAVTSDL